MADTYSSYCGVFDTDRDLARQSRKRRRDHDGTINISINLRFPPSAGDLTNVQNQVIAASGVLWDASEGQLRFGTVTLSCGSVNEDLADMWVFPQAGRAGVSFACNGSNLQAPGVHVNQFLPSSTGIVLGHEFGHLALGLGDEYSEQNRFGACWGYGPCIETAALSEQNQCLMQQPGGFSQTEFCTTAGHDLVVGEGTPCTAGAAPCTTNCGLFNPTTGLYETSQETSVCGGACWPHLVANFPFLVAPAGLPVAAPPAGMVNPVFTNNCQATDTVLLVLDRSGSMLWNTENDFGEVCGNGVDDDSDGSVDETDDCTQPRLAFVQAAARAWLALANGQGVKAGVVSFNQLPSLDAPFQDVNATNLPTLNTAVDNLVAGGNTAIGRALSSTTLLFGGQTGATTKTAFLISDGVNTEVKHRNRSCQAFRRRESGSLRSRREARRTTQHLAKSRGQRQVARLILATPARWSPLSRSNGRVTATLASSFPSCPIASTSAPI